MLYMIPEILSHDMELPVEIPAKSQEEEEFQSAMAEVNDIEPVAPDC